jgi:hypothetical protein
MKPIVNAALIGVAVVTLASLAAAQAGLGEHKAHRTMPGPGPGPGPVPSGSAHWQQRGGQEDLAEQFRKRRPKPEELQAKLGELRKTAGERRDAHRKELRAEFGQALGHKDLQDELAKHARRLAFLNRAKVVATSELDEPKRSAALARIDKLLATENTRHDGAVQKLKTTAPSGLASAAPAAPSGSAP